MLSSRFGCRRRPYVAHYSAMAEILTVSWLVVQMEGRGRPRSWPPPAGPEDALARLPWLPYELQSSAGPSHECASRMSSQQQQQQQQQSDAQRGYRTSAAQTDPDPPLHHHPPSGFQRRLPDLLDSALPPPYVPQPQPPAQHVPPIHIPFHIFPARRR